VIIQCSNCHTRYHYEDARFQGAAVKKIRCTKCATIFEIRNPAVAVIPQGFQADETGPLNSPLLSSDDFALDSTMMGMGRPKKLNPMPPPLPNSPIGRALASSLTAIPPPIVPTGMPPAPLPPVAKPLSREPSTDEFPIASKSGGALDPGKLKLPLGYRLSLACLAGPDSGKIFEIEKPRVTLGRANADITLNDAQCSRQHAAIEVMEDEVQLVDLGSTNGSFYGEKRVTRLDLENRTEFDIGATTLMFIKTRRD